MQKDTRILERILEIKKNTEDDWTQDLERLNIWDELKHFYNIIDNKKNANIIFAFIVLAYDASSEQLELTKDRIDVKRSIMNRLAGTNWKTKEKFLEAVIGDDGGIIDTTIEWYIKRQKDNRWARIIAGFEFDSRAQAMANSASTVKDMNDVASMLNTADTRREKSEALLEQIKKDYVDLDSALDKENKPKITERLSNDENSWELFIQKRAFKIANEEAERKLAEQQKDN